MNTSLGVIFHGPGQDLELRRIPLPEPAGTEILVRVLGCTVCGSDLHTFDGRRETPTPTILGHEIVGEVEALGDAVAGVDLAGRPLRVGDRVTWSIVAHCGSCFYCRRGLPQKCLQMLKYGHEALAPGRELLGGLAEHCLLVPGTAVVRLPASLPLPVACPANCATATVAAAIAAAGEMRDATVCVFGLGMLGLTASAMLRAKGAAHVVGVDVNERRVARGDTFGATHAVRPDELAPLALSLTEGQGFDVILELSGKTPAFACGWNLVRLGGTLVLVGSVFPAEPVAMHLEAIVRRNVTIRGIHNYAPKDLVNAVEFLAEHHEAFPFASLVDAWFPLEHAAEAFACSHDPEHIRVGVRPRWAG